jgi:galactose mutarotase-like enzyme
MPAEMKDRWTQEFTGPYVGTQLAPWVNRVDHGRYTFGGKGSTFRRVNSACLALNDE